MTNPVSAVGTTTYVSTQVEEEQKEKTEQYSEVFSTESSEIFDVYERIAEKNADFQKKQDDTEKLKNEKENKQVVKNLYNSFCVGKDGKFSLGKTLFNGFLCTLSPGSTIALGAIKVAGEIMDVKINGVD